MIPILIGEILGPGTRRVSPLASIASEVMKRLLAPWSYGLTAARHLAWYVSYQVTGEARERH